MKVVESIKRASRYFYYRFIRLQANSESLARGVALGLFISTTPTFGIQTFIALFLPQYSVAVRFAQWYRHS